MNYIQFFARIIMILSDLNISRLHPKAKTAWNFSIMFVFRIMYMQFRVLLTDVIFSLMMKVISIISDFPKSKTEPEDSIFKSSSVIGKNWVTNNKNVAYSSIIEFKDRILTHQDSSTGTLSEIVIDEKDYASGFLV